MKFNNTYDPGIGYEYEQEITVNLCPSNCISKWLDDLEISFEFDVNLNRLDQKFRVYLDSDFESCAITKLIDEE